MGVAVTLASCTGAAMRASDGGDVPQTHDAGGDGSTDLSAATLPLVPVADLPLPGRATRFDYQALDEANRHLVIAHMGDNEVLVVSLADGTVAARIANVGTVRGVAVAASASRIFATAASANQLVIIDAVSLAEIARVATGRAPDGVAWDPVHSVVGVSDQGDGAISLVADRGSGARMQIALGTETGNVTFDPMRGRFWITVVRSGASDQLVGVDPVAGTILDRIDLPGCDGAHGLRLHPNGASAFIACEVNSVMVRVTLDASHAIVTAPVGTGPDVLDIDVERSWLYVAAESGNLTVFDLAREGLVDIDDEHPDDTAHSVAVDPATHRVYFPLVQGASGTPVLRVMQPAGI